MQTCILCEKPVKRKSDVYRPCCRKCERTASMAIQTPGLFIDPFRPATGIALASIAEAKKRIEE